MINRREALQYLTAIFGGVLSAELTAGVMGQVIYVGDSVAVSPAQTQLLAEIADVIIPDTDTPGAKAAGVEQFIIRVMRDCYRWEEQEKFYWGLDRFTEETKAAFGKAFAELSPAEKIEAVKQSTVKNKPFFQQMKQLTVSGYFTSEIGASKALAYLPIPGRFQGEIAMEPGQKSWAL